MCIKYFIVRWTVKGIKGFKGLFFHLRVKYRSHLHPSAIVLLSCERYLCGVFTEIPRLGYEGFLYWSMEGGSPWLKQTGFCD